MRCDFCGHEFDLADAESACAGCPLVRGCHLVRCPRCGYEMPPEAKLVGWLRRLRQRFCSGGIARSRRQAAGSGDPAGAGE